MIISIFNDVNEKTQKYIVKIEIFYKLFITHINNACFNNKNIFM